MDLSEIPVQEYIYKKHVLTLNGNDTMFLCNKVEGFYELWQALLLYCEIDISNLCLEEFISYEFPEASGSCCVIGDIVRDNIITDIVQSKDGNIEMSVDDLYNLIYRDITNYVGRIVL